MQDLKHNRQWSWSDGSSVDYYHWAPGEPNNADGVGEYCVEFYSDHDLDNPAVKYHWNDKSCDISTPMRAFVCKREPAWN